MCGIFESLSPALQAWLRTLSAFHDGRKDLRQYGIELDPGADYPSAVHPVVVRHSSSGRPLLLVNGSFTERIVELGREESDALLRFLCRRISAAQAFQCRVRWQPGTLVIWDNRRTQHLALWDYYPETRRGERVSVRDPRVPIAAD